MHFNFACCCWSGDEDSAAKILLPLPRHTYTEIFAYTAAELTSTHIHMYDQWLGVFHLHLYNSLPFKYALHTTAARKIFNSRLSLYMAFKSTFYFF